MTKEEIAENNELIADFMNVDKLMPHDHQGVYLYNSSWEWLMPVVRKIELLDYYVVIKTVVVKQTKCEISDYDCSFYIDNVHRNKLISVYEIIIKFIKWYNKKRKDEK